MHISVDYIETISTDGNNEGVVDIPSIQFYLDQGIASFWDRLKIAKELQQTLKSLPTKIEIDVLQVLQWGMKYKVETNVSKIGNGLIVLSQKITACQDDEIYIYSLTKIQRASPQIIKLLSDK